MLQGCTHSTQPQHTQLESMLAQHMHTARPTMHSNALRQSYTTFQLTTINCSSQAAQPSVTECAYLCSGRIAAASYQHYHELHKVTNHVQLESIREY